MLLPAPQSSLPPRALYPRPTPLSSSTKYQLVSLFPAHNCMSIKTLYTIKKTKNPLSSLLVSLARSSLRLLALYMSSGEHRSVRIFFVSNYLLRGGGLTRRWSLAAGTSQQPTPRGRVKKPCWQRGNSGKAAPPENVGAREHRGGHTSYRVLSTRQLKESRDEESETDGLLSDVEWTSVVGPDPAATRTAEVRLIKKGLKSVATPCK